MPRKSVKKLKSNTPDAKKVLRDLMEQLVGVGIAVEGEDAGQWADAEGLSFREAWKCLGYAVQIH